MNRPTIVAVGGFASDVGKTTLMCRLLKSLPGWEAIKTTRGHYRSCGKDPHACCVSHLLGDEPVVRSGREQTYNPDYLIMVARGNDIKIKGSARRALRKASALYFCGAAEHEDHALPSFCEWARSSELRHLVERLQIYKRAFLSY